MAIFNPIGALPGLDKEVLPEKLETFVARLPGLLLGAIIFCLCCKYTKRVYFHPLSGIPGPSIPAATHLYEAYHNIIGTELSKKCISMHNKYSQWAFYTSLGGIVF